MSSTVTPGHAQAASGLFGVLWSGRTYLDLLYLISGLPLATFSFTFVVTVMSVGVGLAWTFVGLPLLVLGLVVSRSLVRLECTLVERLTGHQMPRVDIAVTPGRSFWRGVWPTLKDSDSWLSVAYLLARFPLAVVGFCIAISLVAGSVWAITQPIIAPLAAWIGHPQEYGAWTIDTVWEGLLFVPGGVLFLFLSLHVVKGITWLMAESTRLMIGRIGHLRMRHQVLRMLAGGRMLDGASLLHELRLFNGFSVDLNPTKVYATLLGLKSAGLAQSQESDGVEWFNLTPRGEQAVADQAAALAR